MVDIHIQALQDACSHTLTLPQEPQQQVLSTDVGVVEGLGLLAGQSQDFFHPRGVRNITRGFSVRAHADLLFDSGTHGVQVKAKPLQHANGNALAQVDQPQQQVLGADIIVVKAIGLFARQGKHLLSPGSEVVHRFCHAV